MLIDLTHVVKPGMPICPGDPSILVEPAATFPHNGFQTSKLTLSSHAGTHIDAPAHILREGAGLEHTPISQFYGRAVTLDVSQVGPVITAEFLQAQNGMLRTVDFVLFYTGWEKKWDTPEYYQDGYPVPDEAAAKYLVSCGLKGVGTDAPSVDAMGDDGLPAHRVFLNDGMLIVESLCLKKVVGRNDFLFIALPLKFENADGAPVRAVAELRESPEKEMSIL